VTQPDIFVFAQEATSRLTYVLDLFFGNRFALISNVDVYQSATGIKINYSDQQLPGYQIIPNSLLFESNLREINVGVGPDWFNCSTLSLDDKPFDVFASAFYLVSRYEEYLPFEPDDHNRFPAKASCLVKLGLIRKPMVNQWRKALYKELGLSHDFKFEYLSTIDVDQAWKYHNKGFLRNLGGLWRDWRSGDNDLVSQRIDVLIKGRPDPFYNFDYQDKLHNQFGTTVKYFVQVGKRGDYDKNTDSGNQSFQSLIHRLVRHEQCSVGLHPSYQSNSEFHILLQEHQTITAIEPSAGVISRQHFLKHRFPVTYQRLIQLGVREEYTLGYTSHSGFRAGIADRFYFFDLENNEKTDLLLVPFCYMDITPLHYDKLSLEQAIDDMKRFMDEVRSVDGLFCSLWHNESLSDDGRWQGWRPLYEEMVAYGE